MPSLSSLFFPKQRACSQAIIKGAQCHPNIHDREGHSFFHEQLKHPRQFDLNLTEKYFVSLIDRLRPFYSKENINLLSFLRVVQCILKGTKIGNRACYIIAKKSYDDNTQYERTAFDI